MKFDFDKVINQKLMIDQLEVQSFDLNLYLVKLKIDGNSGMLYQNQAIKRFQSAQQIRDAFASVHVVKALMTHQSAYDEMIGNPPKASEALVLPFSMT